MKKVRSLLIASCSFLSLSLSASGGPLSTLYLTDHVEGKLYGVQGSSVTLNASATSTQQSPIAVGSTIRTFGLFRGDSGAEYSLSGTPTGSVYPNTIASAYFLDGATDGFFNYAWHVGEGRAYRFDLNWSSPTILFTIGIGEGSRAGITYDPTNGTLWVSGATGAITGKLENYTLNGVRLLQYATVPGVGSSVLAFDPADQTLWLNEIRLSSTVYNQFSRAGVFLSSQSYPSLSSGGIEGGEFAVPEPSTPLLMLFGLLAFMQRSSARRAALSAMTSND